MRKNLSKIMLLALLVTTLLPASYVLADFFVTFIGATQYTGISLDPPDSPASGTFANPAASSLRTELRAWNGSGTSCAQKDIEFCTNCTETNVATVSAILPPAYYTAQHQLAGANTRYTSWGGSTSSASFFNGNGSSCP